MAATAPTPPTPPTPPTVPAVTLGGQAAHESAQVQGDAQQEKDARSAAAEGDGARTLTTQTATEAQGDAKQGAQNASGEDAQNAQASTVQGAQAQGAPGAGSFDPNTAAILEGAGREQQGAQAQTAVQADAALPSGGLLSHGAFFWGAAIGASVLVAAFLVYTALRRKKKAGAFGVADFRDKWERRAAERKAQERPARAGAAQGAGRAMQEEHLPQYTGLTPDEVLAGLAAPVPRPRASVRAYAEQPKKPLMPDKTKAAAPHAENQKAPPAPKRARPIEREQKDEAVHFEVRV